MNRYEKIMARKDGSRPHFMEELSDFEPKSLILSIKILNPDGSSLELKWSEKSADRIMKEFNAAKQPQGKENEDEGK